MPHTKQLRSPRPITLARRLFALEKSFQKFDQTRGNVRPDEHEHVRRIFEDLERATQRLQTQLVRIARMQAELG